MAKKIKFVDSHVLKSFYIRTELWKDFDTLANEQGHGAKTELINKAIELLLEKYKNDAAKTESSF